MSMRHGATTSTPLKLSAPYRQELLAHLAWLLLVVVDLGITCTAVQRAVTNAHRFDLDVQTMRSMTSIRASSAYRVHQPEKKGMNDIQYHPQNLKAGRLSVQPAKRSLHRIPSISCR